MYDAAIANARTAELASGGDGVLHARGGVPFPIPNEGVEAIWNHILRYRGQTTYQIIGQVVPTAGGAYTYQRFVQRLMWPYHRPGATTEETIKKNRLFYYEGLVAAPARIAGIVILLHEPIDQVREPRQGWSYSPGSRRVRRAPHIAPPRRPVLRNRPPIR